MTLGVNIIQPKQTILICVYAVGVMKVIVLFLTHRIFLLLKNNLYSWI